MLIRTLTDAAIVLQEMRYADAAGRDADFIWSIHRAKALDLKRFSFKGKVSVLNGTQPDYAYLGIFLCDVV